MLGVLHAGKKRKWLELRYQTKRLRQFYFQSAIALLPELLAHEANPADRRFETERDEWFGRFAVLHLDGASQRLGAILAEQDTEGWMFGSLPSAAPRDSKAFRDFESQYRHYQLAAQIDYCDKKLKKRSPAWKPETPAEQSAIFGTVALFCILGATVLHIIAAGAPEFVLPHAARPALNVGVLWLAVGVLAVRALEEGLRPHREVERYQQYRSALRTIELALDAASTPAEKIVAMKQLRPALVRGMVNFLKDNESAESVM